ncbi:mitochondrial 39-S ribosomal protein L47 (MRP-L47)-domain-containing protein [Xylaria grammica]|nr:mitochondrial 39-S ribosomal protein L47 (MRP-L47)-domain-containing protein [Xylaria grammica]
MATPAYIRPLISRVAGATRVFSNTSTSLVAVSPPTSSQRCQFSSTSKYNNRRPRRDNNRLRGLSSIYRSGTRFRMNIDKSETPKPADYKPEIQVDPNHGLYDFFYAKDKLMLTPEESAEHGRAWTVEELRHKSWEDLHKLWWVCVKEQNRIATAHKESGRLDFVDGKEEADARMGEVRRTMSRIRHALTERWYLWEDARKVAETDPEIDLSNARSPFTPKDYLEDHESAPGGNNEDDHVPPGFMTEEPGVTKPRDIEPSTISPKPLETSPSSVKP